MDLSSHLSYDQRSSNIFDDRSSPSCDKLLPRKVVSMNVSRLIVSVYAADTLYISMPLSRGPMIRRAPKETQWVPHTFAPAAPHPRTAPGSFAKERHMCQPHGDPTSPESPPNVANPVASYW